MPLTGTALLVAIGIGFSIWGGRAVAHGVKKAAHAVHTHKRPAAPPAKAN